MRMALAGDKTDTSHGRGSNYVRPMAVLRKSVASYRKGNGKCTALVKDSEEPIHSKCLRNLRIAETFCWKKNTSKMVI